MGEDEKEVNVVEVHRLLGDARRMIVNLRDQADELELCLDAIIEELPEEPEAEAEAGEADKELVAIEEPIGAPLEPAAAKLEQSQESA